MVENVEEVGRKLQLEAFGDGGLLAEPEVQIPEGETAQRVAPAGAPVLADKNLTELVDCGLGTRKYIDT